MQILIGIAVIAFLCFLFGRERAIKIVAGVAVLGVIGFAVLFVGFNAYDKSEKNARVPFCRAHTGQLIQNTDEAGAHSYYIWSNYSDCIDNGFPDFVHDVQEDNKGVPAAYTGRNAGDIYRQHRGTYWQVNYQTPEYQK